MENSSVIKMEQVGFRYGGNEVLANINIDIPMGDFVGLIGPNGSGKSTLIKLMLGLLEPQGGEIELFGTPIKQFKEWGKIGYVPQRPGTNQIPFPVTAVEVVGMQAKTAKGAKQALEKVGVGELANRAINKMSGGQLQRVFIARALVNAPQLLIMDEPTAGVDEESQSEFYRLLEKFHHEGMTILLVSHDVDVVAHEVNHLLCLNKTIVCHGRPAEVMKKEFWQQLYGKELKMVVHGH